MRELARELIALIVPGALFFLAWTRGWPVRDEIGFGLLSALIVIGRPDA